MSKESRNKPYSHWTSNHIPKPYCIFTSILTLSTAIASMIQVQ